ncbi:16S rRNA (guanine(527)-N(7))-methyltransferase RsmG [Deinococcus radiomollis]|uniref:16S rRNA (guanine(527)-N(7))-methyltransferase RsmG n=1 Tax=Deinococcus radiomollis TaxID=468916 RepID=UPI003891C741
MKLESQALLLEGAAVQGLGVSDQLGRFALLLKLLQEGNARFNLTALKSERDIVLKHFVDSLTCLRGGFLEGELTVLDLGTGAGFPSLPLALVRPLLSLVPLDSTRKKIEYVRATAETLELNNVSPLVGRAETLGHDPAHREGYDRVVVRAVAALPVLAELALPLLRPGGLLVAQKGRVTEEELSAGRRAAKLLGGAVEAVTPFELPILGDPRTLVCIRKTGPTPKKYPRQDGLPAKHPLS